MHWSVENLTQAKNAVRDLLEEVVGQDFLFEVEPDPLAPDVWLVRVECQGREGWKVAELRVSRHALERSGRPKSEERLEIVEAWRSRLS